MARTQIRGNTQIMDLTITNAQIDATAGIELSKIQNGANIVVADATTGAVADLNMGGNKITNLGLGTDPNDAVTKSQLDAVSAGLDPKESVRLASTGHLPLSGLDDIDGITPVNGDRILVKDQTSAVENGIYVADSGAWTRSTDFDGTPANEVSGGGFTFVEQGSQGGSGWVVVADGNVVVDTDPIVFTLFSSAGAYTAGTAIDISAGVISAKYDNSTIGVNGSDQLYVPTGGITANEIAANTITAAEIAAGTITATEIAADTITSAEIAADAITSSELAANAVDSVHIVAGAIDSTHFSESAIDGLFGGLAGTGLTYDTTTNSLTVDVDNSTIVFSGNQLTVGVIDSANIATGAIDGSHISTAAVDSIHIAAGAIDSTHLSEALLDSLGGNLAGLGLSYDSTNNVLDVNVDGTTIEITGDTLNVVAGGIGTTELADLAVTTAKIADAAVTWAKIDTSIFGTGLLTDSTSVYVDFSGYSRYDAWTKYSWPTETITTNTLVYTFNGGNDIVANTFELYLNGVLLEPGAGNDYTVELTGVNAGKVTFASPGDAPRTNDKLYAHFVSAV